MALALLRMQSPCCNLHKNRFVYQKVIKNGLENIGIRACSSKTKVGGICIYNFFPHYVFSARNQDFFPNTFLSVTLLGVTVYRFQLCLFIFLSETMQYTIPHKYLQYTSSQRPCSTLFLPETMQYTIPPKDHAVHYSSLRPCGTLFLPETMQYTIPP